MRTDNSKGKTWLGVIIMIVMFCVFIGTLGKDDDTQTITTPTDALNDVDEDITNSDYSSNDIADYSSDENEDISDNTSDSNLSLGQQNALSKAEDYLNYSSFSYDGLIKQLEFEGYSNEEAKYAVDNCGADWNEQAGKKAQDYLDYSSFSHDGLIEQLKFDGFTTEQAEYGVKAVGY